MGTPYIEAALEMTKEFLDGEMSRLDYRLDFPYEIVQTYRLMKRENARIANMIYDCLVESDIDEGRSLSDEEFYYRVLAHYQMICDALG